MGLVPGGTQKDVTFLLQGMQGREAVIGRAGQAEVEKGWVNGPSALPHPTACPSQKHKLTLIHMGLALGIVGTLARDTPSCLLAGPCRVVAGRQLVCTDRFKTSWGCDLPLPTPLPVPCLAFSCTWQAPKR